MPMSTENYTNQNSGLHNPSLDAQGDEVAAGGSNKLFYILGALLLALVVSYIALPKCKGNAMSSVTPTFMLDDAAVTATAPTGADSIVAGLKAAPTAAVNGSTDKAIAKTSTAVKPVAIARPAAAPAAGATTAPAMAVAAGAPATEATAVPEAAPTAPASATVPASATAAALAQTAAPEPVTTPAKHTLTGRIIDENGRPLVGATVLLRGSTKGATTDINGNYSLEVPTVTENVLIYGYAGYEDDVVHARGTQPVNVTLTPRVKERRRRR